MGKRPVLTQYEVASARRRRVALVLLCAVLPLVLLLFAVYQQRHRLLFSLLVLCAAMCPFFMTFERRRPRARELVLIAVLCALITAGQVAFHVLMPVQIGTALVLATGVGLGPEAGFLAGALSRLLCNFYMGQGAWTPWQMFSWGMLGFLAGAAFGSCRSKQTKKSCFVGTASTAVCMAFALLAAWVSRLWVNEQAGRAWGWQLYAFGAAGLLCSILLQQGHLPVNSLMLSLFTFFTTFIVYGGIMNIHAMLSSAALPGSEGVSWRALKLFYFSAVPYDFYHALTASICMFLIGEPLIAKLERVKIKYGIYR